jgi:methylmalonyl-CoA mutase N-terminal domain/subunit
LAGSYFIEDLTDKIELETLKLIKEVDNQGGAISAIENSFQQNEIANSSFDYQSDIESGKQTIVGVNKFKDTRSKSANDLFPVDNLSAKEQLKRLKQFKKNRSLGSVQASLNELIKSLNSNKNLIPKIITCIKNSCTLGEICDVIKSKYGTY